ncbi:type II toxin-antitoxin system RelE/ParE family toxin [filamentous cyanobacterium LEGE 11480]|uniref:Type II toxin-antitoxin system RelE/ParE family toxin n=1 Tax=Romeriopsis navalis LEGE 11480 TaxID=2777977 RepID=A0A928Z5N5_9CYAN|nr:type II toxin-antitoxin system RelE/ParE family toxin [Romeriopsis navalis]MBE9033004.1 type II toxin-antitoxin system RelE/ParE family toxin [Romeriopsis navalis LEGE 11480]
MIEAARVDVRFSVPFLKRLKALAKRYRQIQQDIQPVLEALAVGDFVGDRIVGTGLIVFKVRAKNSDIPVGKSGGYRLIYQVVSPESVSLLLIYAKSDQADVTVEEILAAVEQGLL